MTLREFRDQRMAEAAAAVGADVLVATLPENVVYISGYFSVNFNVLQRSECYALFRPADGKMAIVASIAELPSIVESVGEDVDMYCCGSFRFSGVEGFPLYELQKKVRAERCYANITAALSAALADFGAKRVALDESRICVGNWKKTVESNPDIEFLPGTDVFMKARLVKHEEEIAGLERAAEIAEAALAAALKDFKVGMTERDMERVYLEELARQGAEPLFFVATAAKRAAYSDTKNTDLAVRKGDFIRFDFGCIWHGYNADLARTAVMGQPDEKTAVYYEAVRRGTADAIAAIKPGVTTAEEVFEIAVNVTRENGLAHYERHHCGHGIGIECYDYPSIAPGDKTVLVEGMVLNVETPYYELGWGGVQAESTVVLTAEGPRYLDKSSDALIILEA